MTEQPTIPEGPKAHFFSFIDVDSGCRVELHTVLYHRYENGRLQGQIIGVLVSPPNTGVPAQLDPPSENPDAGMGVEGAAQLGEITVGVENNVTPPADTEPELA